MRTYVAWKDERGVTHAMIDDEMSEYSAPFSLRAFCAHGSHFHDHSNKIRARSWKGPVTCVPCTHRLIAEPRWEVLESEQARAPCCPY